MITPNVRSSQPTFRDDYDLKIPVCTRFIQRAGSSEALELHHPALEERLSFGLRGPCLVRCISQDTIERTPFLDTEER